MTTVINNETTRPTARHQKIAIVGVACRLPGHIQSLADYWQVLINGKDVVTEISEERFATSFYQHDQRKTAGRSVTFSAGVLDQVDQFDASFFGISPREAEQMDPQQRLLLELTWEALENAGQAPERLAGSDCAVYVGIASTDYLNRRVEDPASMDAYTMTGNTASIAANRISYLFDLLGPSVAVDTACSSSLVAVHHACQALRHGEASMAIAAGVNMLLHPFAFIGFSQASMLSAKGRCRTFDANGDGYVRAEGAAVLLLKPLAQAEADNDPIYGVIVASGINADGKTNGMTVPSDRQQGRLLRKIYTEAQLDANDLVYLEAHGTGTSIGDPLETRAIGEVLGRARANKPLLIGSAKSNVGHLETASGMAGLLKALLTLKHQTIPPSLHVETLNPKIDFNDLNLQVVTQTTPIASQQTRQLVGVNSFGFGGANAHVVIEHYSPPRLITSKKSLKKTFPPLYLSARTGAALKGLAAQYAAFLTEQNADDVAWSLLKHRQHLAQGLVVQANDVEAAKSTLAAYAKGESSNTASLIEGRVVADHTPLTLVFSGNGSQWQGMGQVLLAQNPLFKQTIEHVDALFKPLAGYALMDLLLASEAESQLAKTEIAQPLLFALQVAMVTVLKSHGVLFNATLGHSVGEVAAAWAAGKLSLEQAVQVIYYRSQAQGTTRGQGRMAALGLGQAALQERLVAVGLQDKIELAGVNSPMSVTISGTLADLEQLQASLSADKVFFKLLDLDYAFHSHWMDPIREQLLLSLQHLAPEDHSPELQFISAVTGQATPASALDADYWWRNIREPVAFSAAMDTLIGQGARVFLEVGPHLVLRGYMNECLRHRAVEGQTLITGKRKDEQADCLAKAAQRVWLAGCDLEVASIFPESGHFIQLPNYPWQRERYWYPLTVEGYDLVNRRRVHPLLGYRLKDAEWMWENQLDTVILPWLADHVVDGAVVVPAAAYVEMALAAAQQWQAQATQTLEQLEIVAPIILDGTQAKTLRFHLLATDGSFTITSRERLSHEAWAVNVVGRLTGAALKSAPVIFVQQWQEEQNHASASLNASKHYQLTEAVGLRYLAAFQAVEQVAVQENAALATLCWPEAIQADLQTYHLHPALLDAGFQLLVDILAERIEQGQRQALIPIQIGRLFYYGSRQAPTHIRVQLRQHSARSVVADFVLLDTDYQTVAELQACRFRAVQFASARIKEPANYSFTSIPKPLVASQLSAPTLEMAKLQQQILATWRKQAELLGRERQATHIDPLLDVLASAYSWEALSALADHGRFTLEQVSEAHRTLARRLLTWLEEEGLAHQQEGHTWAIATETHLPKAQDIWLAVLGDAPAYLPELVMMGRSGLHLAEVLRGNIAPEQIVQPAKSSIAEHWLESSPSFRAVNQTLVETIQTYVSRVPAQQTLRVLELGAGFGALTQYLLHVLPPERCDYVVTDPSAEHLAQISDLIETLPWVSSLILAEDISGAGFDILAQQAAFDLVISGNAIFAWQELAPSLARLRTLLKPQALLLLAQAQDSRLLDLTCGLLPNWWLNSESAALSRLHTLSEWQNALAQNGFDAIEACFEPNDLDADSALFLVSAQANASNTFKPQADLKAQTWLILSDAQGYSAKLAMSLQDHLLSQGQAVQVLSRAPSATELQVEHIIYLSGITALSEQVLDVMALQEQRCIALVTLVQQLDAHQLTPQLWLVTADAMPDGAHPIQAAQAPLWGLGRVLMNEHAELNCRLLDIQSDQTLAQVCAALAQEFLYNDGEDEVLLTAHGREVMRLKPSSLSDVISDETPPVALDFTTPGLKHLYWRALSEHRLQPDEIEILSRAVGLNFRDVMYAMGLLSDEAVENGFAGASLGMELSGQVTRVGSSVSEFKVGDAVMGFAPACFSSRVITKTTAMTHKPSAWSDEEAATVPTTFFTVYYALKHLAQLEAGERILIHGAAGGVGLAAIQFARYCGAEIFASAGTDEKRDFVRLAGVDADHVLDSRNLRFAEDILTLTNGQGVDVILNSISGEAINRNLHILRPFGRFLELGKRDFYENSKIGLRPFRNNISYFGIDADQLLLERPALARRLFREMMQLFDKGVLRPLPHRVFPATAIQTAFRYMQQSRQIGKVVVSFADELLLPSVKPQRSAPLSLKQDGTYLITGGLTGFGLATARWLATKGAGHLALLSRRGLKTPEASAAVAALEALGTKVTVFAVDVADKAALAQVLETIRNTLPALRGIIHAAMVLDDGLIRNADAERFRRVLTPKVLGAWHLHLLTQQEVLDFFVFYSSVTTYLGNPGQANYVAANAFLESLTHARRAAGLPAVYAAWGPIADAGYLVDNQNVKEALQSRLGGEALTVACALASLETLLQSDKAGAAIVDLDWVAIQRVMAAARAPKFSLVKAKTKQDENAQTDDIHALMAGMSVSEAQALIAELLMLEVGHILRLPREKMALDKSVFELGMDSLMGMELVSAIDERFGVRLPVMALTEGGATIQRIAGKIAAQLTSQTDAAAPNEQELQQMAVAEVVRKHGSLAEVQVATLAQQLTQTDTISASRKDKE
ncbi:type I polyketide synthase [Thiolinea disciformis]|uniref:type I polyketide synthase n=1 Tax=Thiolinea disciformis TaxID=125614 RepID=UPI000363CBCE|nr:type I polyketide synthase [Thiolinea disciformis]